MKHLFLFLLSFAVSAFAAEATSWYVFNGPKKGWGVVTAEAPWYGPDGKSLGSVQPGTLLTYDGIAKINGNSDAFHGIFRVDGEEKGPAVVGGEFVLAFPGSPERLPDETVAALCNYYRLKSAETKYLANLEAKHRERAPAWKTYLQARAAYQQTLPEAEKLNAEAARAKGSALIRLQDRQRELKQRQIRLADSLAAARKQVEAWEAKNPFNRAAAESGEMVVKIRAKREEILPLIKNLLPSGE